MGKSAKAPAAPDPYATANAQSQANAAAVEKSAQVNQINQYSPYGSITYSGDVGSPNRSVTTQLSPAQQQQLDQQNQLAQLLGQNALGQAANIPSTPFSLDGQPQLYGTGTTLDGNAKATQDAVFQQGMGQIQPMLDQQNRETSQMLQDRGIPLGSDAYNKEMDRVANSQGQQINNLSLGSVQAGNAEQAQLFGLSQAARQQGISDSLLERTQPINEISAFLQGTPALQQPNQVSTAQYNVAPPDVMGAFNTQYQGQLNAYNQQQQASNSALGGLMGLGGTLGAAYMLSDRTMKRDIVLLGRDIINGLKVYAFRYVGQAKRHVGYMAQEVEKIFPNAVVEINGIKHVDYGQILGV